MNQHTTHDKAIQFQMISLLNLIFFIFSFRPLASSSSPTHKPGCPARCGNVTIPYPYGVGPRCSLGSSFNIACNTSTTPPKPYLNIRNDNMEVVEIRTDNPAQIRIWYPHLIYAVCHNLNSDEETSVDRWEIDLSETQYTLSEDNWMTTIGCDDYGSTTTTQGDKEDRDACVGFCSDNSSDVGICPNNGDSNSIGEGCCRVPIAKGNHQYFSVAQALAKLDTPSVSSYLSRILFLTVISYLSVFHLW